MRSLLLALAVCALVTSAGCHHNVCRNGACGTCGPTGGCRSGGCMMGCKHCGGGGRLAGHGGATLFHGPRLHNGSLCQPGPMHWMQGGTGHIPSLPDGVYGNHVGYIGDGGPAGPTVGYPYYTTRAPRDFLQDNPPSIGR